MRHVAVVDDSGNGRIAINRQVRLAEEASLEYIRVGSGARLDRESLRAGLAGPRSRFRHGHLMMVDTGRRAELDLEIAHHARHAESESLCRCVLGAESQGGFAGKILISRDGQGADARLRNDNLLLDESARMETRPELEVYADEVQCAHGAATGALDEAALFYLRTPRIAAGCGPGDAGAGVRLLDQRQHRNAPGAGNGRRDAQPRASGPGAATAGGLNVMSSATARLAAVKEPLSAQTLRVDFPSLATTVHGKPLAYLDNAASTQRPQAVMDALTAYEVGMHANVHRGVHARSDKATAAFEGARERTRRWLNAASSKEIVFTRGATESINLVARCMDACMDADSEIVLTDMEHHSNIVPWQQLCERTGARIRVVPVLDSGELDMAALSGLIGSKTQLVAVTHVSNALGVINPVAEICGLARNAGVPILIDGAQAAGHIPLDVQELGCDFYALSGHKMYAPTGIGALYARKPWAGSTAAVSGRRRDDP